MRLFSHVNWAAWHLVMVVGASVAFLAGGFGGGASAATPATRPVVRPRVFHWDRLVREGDMPGVNAPVVDRAPVFRACFDAKGTRLLAAMADEVRVYDVPSMTPAMT